MDGSPVWFRGSQCDNLSGVIQGDLSGMASLVWFRGSHPSMDDVPCVILEVPV
jgi:hypothetical protein